jgi:hypothetical protein
LRLCSPHLSRSCSRHFQRNGARRGRRQCRRWHSWRYCRRRGRRREWGARQPRATLPSPLGVCAQISLSPSPAPSLSLLTDRRGRFLARDCTLMVLKRQRSHSSTANSRAGSRPPAGRPSPCCGLRRCGAPPFASDQLFGDDTIEKTLDRDYLRWLSG